MTKLDPANVALRRDPYTRQEVLQGPNGRFCGWVDGALATWDKYGNGYINLIPLQTRPAALRCWAILEDGETYTSAGCPSDFWREMIERAPAEALAKAVEWNNQKMIVDALAAYRAAYPEDGK